MKKFFKEFIEFINKGNVLDLAIAIIIGNAFNKIVSSLVNDIIMPLVGLIGKKNIQEAKLTLVDAVIDESGNVVRNAVTLNYGSFIQYIIDFLIIALTVFVMLKVIKALERRAERIKEKVKKKLEEEIEEKFKKKTLEGDAVEVEEVKAEAEPVTTQETVTEEKKPTTEDILLEIRDLLKK